MSVIGVKIERRGDYAGGQSFGDAGPYEEIAGSVEFAVDPVREANAGIVDLERAPRDAEGRVRFRSDFTLITPKIPARGNGRLLADVPNRGRRLFGQLNRAPALDGVPAGSDPGDGFLFRQGWTIGSVAWQWDVLPGGPLLCFEAPPVLEDGRPVRGQAIVTIRTNGRDTTALLANRQHRVYPAASLDEDNGRLYVRDYETGPDEVVPRSRWRFARETAEGVRPSAEHLYMEGGFEPGRVYNLVYEAEGAVVVGAGLLAYRDFAAWLKVGASQLGLPALREAYGFGVSQTGRFLRHFLYLGLNLDEDGRQMFDGLLVHVAGSRRGEFNHRFAQPSVSSTPGFGNLFPFADEPHEDPYGCGRAGVLDRQRSRGGVPRVIYTNTSAEYWRGDAALLHVDPSGDKDMAPAAETRVYHFAGTQHVAGSLPPRDSNANDGSRGRYTFNVVDYGPLLRAALVNLQRWVSEGVAPPPSAYPSLAAGSLVPPAEALAALSRLPGLATPDPQRLLGVHALDLGPRAGVGIGAYPARLGEAYARLVPAVDADGNDVSGVKLPDITSPVGTHSGWNLRHPETGMPEQTIPMMGFTRFLPRSAAEAAANSDPRRPLDERYAGREAYAELAKQQAQRLANERFLLPQDVELVTENALRRYDFALAREGAASPK